MTCEWILHISILVIGKATCRSSVQESPETDNPSQNIVGLKDPFLEPVSCHCGGSLGLGLPSFKFCLAIVLVLLQPHQVC